MNLTNARATFGLNAKATPTSSNVSGSVQIGATNASTLFPDADVVYSLRAIFTGSSSNSASIDFFDGTAVTVTTLFSGNAQVETSTVTATSGATSSGTMTLVLTSAGMTGSPLNVPVALVTGTHTTAALIATAARTALTATAVIAERFTVGGTGADIVLTRKPTSTFTVPTGTLSLYAANDATLNLAIPSGLGVTAALSSTNTTSAVASDGVKIYDQGFDFEGDALPTITKVHAIQIKNAGTSAVTLSGNIDDVIPIQSGATVLLSGDATTGLNIDATGHVIGSAGVADLTITVIGQTA